MLAYTYNPSVSGGDPLVSFWWGRVLSLIDKRFSKQTLKEVQEFSGNGREKQQGGYAGSLSSCPDVGHGVRGGSHACPLSQTWKLERRTVRKSSVREASQAEGQCLKGKG